jgi:hypothetical protein
VAHAALDDLPGERQAVDDVFCDDGQGFGTKEVAARLLFLDSVKVLLGGCAAKGVMT